MARTKQQIKLQLQKERAIRANRLAAVAQCMDGYMWKRAEASEKKIEELEQQLRQKTKDHEKCIKELKERVMLQFDIMQNRYQERIHSLEQGWDDLADSLHHAITELENLRRVNRRLEEQLLDQSFESETLSD